MFKKKRYDCMLKMFCNKKITKHIHKKLLTVLKDKFNIK